MQSAEKLAGPNLGIYNELFVKLNPMAKAELEAANIAAFLKTARGVNVAQLSQIWEISSELSGYKNRAVLNRLGIFICFKFVAAIQQGFGLSPAILSSSSLGPPQFDSIPIPPPPTFAASKSPSIASEIGWSIGGEEQRKYEAIFDNLSPIGEKLSGDQCRPVLLNSQLAKTQLAKIWELADIDGDGHLDRPEFCVALHLVYKCLQNEQIPDRLPMALVPFGKRQILHQISVPSVEPTIGHQHPPPLTWSSRASSVASLNFQPPLQGGPISPQNLGPKRGSFFDQNVEDIWVDNLGKYEAEFGELDKDGDSLVSGTDVREMFIRSGLAQPMLAHIWGHVDVQKRGKLNLEQFAKCQMLIQECQQQQEESTQQNANAISPPMMALPPGGGGTLARRDSQISTNSGSGTKSLLAENPRVQELMGAIEEMQANRRKAEQDLFQAEADLKVKNSEVKNLEIELLTLEATAKQLKNQRVEANKRLNDLDTRIAKLEGICGESEKRLEEEEARLGRTKLEIQQAKENSEEEAGILDGLREEARAKRAELARAKQAFGMESCRFEGFVDELTQLERGMARQEEENKRMKEQMEEMKRILEAVDKGEEGANEELLAKTFQGPPENLTALKASSTGQTSKEEDPLERSVVPFNGNSNASKNVPNDDPFTSKSSSSPAAAGVQKSSQSQASGQFANFANFSAFS